MELKTPPLQTRIKMFRNYAEKLGVSEKWLEKIATNEYLAPGLISRAVKVVSELGLEKQVDIETHLEQVISNTQR